MARYQAPAISLDSPLRRIGLASAIVLAAAATTEVAARAFPADGAVQALKYLLVIGAVVGAATIGRFAGLAAGVMGAAYSLYFFPAHVSADDPAEGALLGFGLAVFLVVIGGVLGYVSDRLRSALHRVAEERAVLARAEERAFGIGRLFARIGEAVVVSDVDGRIILWNPAAERIFGYTKDEAMGLNVDVLVPERYRPQHREGMRRFAHTGHGLYVDTHEVLRLPALRKDGSEIVVDLTLSGFEDAGRPGRYALAIMRDVTEQVRLQEQLTASVEELRAANETLEAFTYVVAHDLKEPVRAIEAFSRALEEDHAEALPPDAADLVRRNRETSERLANLLRGLLDYSRATRIHPSQLEPLRIEDVLHSPDCTTRFQNVLDERNTRLVVVPGPAVQASLAALCLVLGNLILNAAKHNPRPNALVRVASRTSRDDPRMVEVCVEDNGPGFPDAVVERFSTARRGRPQTVRGGFGLIIAREAVEKMGGRIELGRSPEGGGSVRILLPGAAPLDEDHGPATTASPKREGRR